jgi:hypothetical protein
VISRFLKVCSEILACGKRYRFADVNQNINLE